MWSLLLYNNNGPVGELQQKEVIVRRRKIIRHDCSKCNHTDEVELSPEYRHNFHFAFLDKNTLTIRLDLAANGEDIAMHLFDDFIYDMLPQDLINKAQIYERLRENDDHRISVGNKKITVNMELINPKSDLEKITKIFEDIKATEV